MGNILWILAVAAPPAAARQWKPPTVPIAGLTTITVSLAIETTLVVTEALPPVLENETKSPTFKLVVKLVLLPTIVLAIRVLAIEPWTCFANPGKLAVWAVLLATTCIVLFCVAFKAPEPNVYSSVPPAWTPDKLNTPTPAVLKFKVALSRNS